MDSNQLLELLAEYYDTSDLEEMKPKLKNDLKCATRLRKLLDFTKFDITELIIHLQAIFSNLFNSVLIRKLRNEIKKL